MDGWIDILSLVIECTDLVTWHYPQNSDGCGISVISCIRNGGAVVTLEATEDVQIVLVYMQLSGEMMLHVAPLNREKCRRGMHIYICKYIHYHLKCIVDIKSENYGISVGPRLDLCLLCAPENAAHPFCPLKCTNIFMNKQRLSFMQTSMGSLKPESNDLSLFFSNLVIW